MSHRGAVIHLATPMAQTVKNLPAMQESQVWSLGWDNPWRREWKPTPVFLPGEFHEQRSLVGYSPLATDSQRVGFKWETNTFIPAPPQLQAIISCGECVVAQNAYMLMIQVGEVNQLIRSSWMAHGFQHLCDSFFSCEIWLGREDVLVPASSVVWSRFESSLSVL